MPLFLKHRISPIDKQITSNFGNTDYQDKTGKIFLKQTGN